MGDLPEDRFKQEDLMIPHQCKAGYLVPNVGAEIDKIDEFTTGLRRRVDQMKKDMVHETRILEGTEMPKYTQNEFSHPKLTDEQWKSLSIDGCSTIDPIPDSTVESNNSVSFVSCSNPDSVIHTFSDKYGQQSSPSCPVIWANCGFVTDVMNESCECMVPTTSELMLGTPNEVK